MGEKYNLILIIAIIVSVIMCLINILSINNDYYLEYANNICKKEHLLNYCKTIGSAFPMLTIVFLLRSFVCEPFRIPSASMMPTLLIGDFIFVKKFSYNIQIPFLKKLIHIKPPKRGDIVVFRYPPNPKLYYIKRIIGLPGDKITYDVNKKVLIITPNYLQNIISKKELPINYSNIQSSNFIQVFNNANYNIIADRFYKVPQNKKIFGGYRLLMRTETLDNVSHDILFIDKLPNQLNMYYHQPGQKEGSWLVPKDQYFMMGDNRDNSADSRYWGFVPEGNLIGKAVIIWLSFEKQEGKWPTGIRLSHIGYIN
ncbi:signal peptidase I [Candidatus Ishikawella capsulata]|uniref:Signal peptidase I n=1 Tax=Candidatus Ishikawaella capsulata Mpkobe TaxID=476281 RepID=C5WD99_9ENTR|nr:signal peptidase I [Candidatus Ishikawaella capsulata]BAH83305.1 leader peptidase [Candidatus Ishikawaella capsulata Mpkobe]